MSGQEERVRRAAEVLAEHLAGPHLWASADAETRTRWTANQMPMARAALAAADDDLVERIAGEVAHVEQEYATRIRATRGTHNDEDYWRWNGHAEQLRTTSERLRSALGLPAVDLKSNEWREANGAAP